MRDFFFDFSSEVTNLVEFAKKGVFSTFDIRRSIYVFFCGCQKRHFRNFTSPSVDEHRMESTVFNVDLIGCKSTEKVRGIDNLEHKSENKKI